MSDFNGEDLYAILGVARSASPTDIQAAYKQKARKLHPDINKSPNAEDQFKALAAAYAILKDPDKRQRYDRFGFERRGSSAAGPNEGTGRGSRGFKGAEDFAAGVAQTWRERSAPWNGPQTNPSKSSRGRQPDFQPADFGFEDVKFEDINVDAEDLRHPFDFFLRREQRKRKTHEVRLEITLVQAYKGTTLSLLIDMANEAGRTETKRLKVKIPRGAKEGDRLKLKDPECTVILALKEDPGWLVDGRDVHTTMDITPWEGALGGTVTLATPGGPVTLKVPPGSSSGQKLRLRGKGLPLKPGKEGKPGDLYATLRVVVPHNLTQEEKSLFEKLAQASDFSPRN